MKRYLRRLWERAMRWFPWVNPYGEQGRPPMPDAHSLANRLTATSLRRDVITHHDLQTWEARAKWDEMVRGQQTDANG